MRPYHTPGGAGELLARASFLEPLLAGRRVLELGGAAATGGVSARALLDRGAQSVVAADEDAKGIARAAGALADAALTFRALARGELPEGPFDLVVVHDGAPLAADPARVAALARLLAPDGRLVAALPVAGAPSLAALAGYSPAAEAPAYESFVGSLEAVFPVVELATQSAALGWVIAAAADPEPELAVDGAHGEAPEAAAYLAVCGTGPSGLAGMVLVTLPAAQALREAGARTSVDVDSLRADVAAARAEAVAHAAHAEEAERRAEAASAGAPRAREEREALGARAAHAEEEAGRLRTRVEELERALAEARAAGAERVRERDEARRESFARARESRAWADAQAKLEQRIAELDALAASHSREVEIAHVEAARAIAEAEEARTRAEGSRDEADAAERRAGMAEAELRRLAADLERGRVEVERLRAELAQARGHAAGEAQG